MIASPQKIGILLLDDYPIIPFSCVVDSLRKGQPAGGKTESRVGILRA
ncbi:MAG: hypothetical protein O6938_04635 [Gammaproteobacteria bacterium]|nr:hypothetical protein [Gammaproteobacteria bacterium]MCZ6723189.1 hypothetical protein [Gammaproteobacteria bacterium]